MFYSLIVFAAASHRLNAYGILHPYAYRRPNHNSSASGSEKLSPEIYLAQRAARLFGPV